ncbi:hypothetical protein RhiirA5_507386 [Rhizophagus irregularis]|uniref:DUF8211 domain-containing protein n=1 Tax=Rhizophagus irregularis TaxID=588596 RepID=A0A2I1E1R4_9GLOM|nr:hypothetical protein RhiirA5_507386 [Rhizophagus irregularis]PKY16076.1 hypothetical protein RhiirB3_520912 [Rhizophagus irregularis]
MYKKKFINFKHIYSNNARTRRKQYQRFQRRCKRIFRLGNPNAPDTLEDKLIMAKKHRFLFLESQYIDKPIKHLKYSKKTSLPDAQDYQYLLSIFVPDRLRPYIPSQPIYSPKGAIYYAPGSTGWFKYLEKKVESAAKAAINQQEQYFDIITPHQSHYSSFRPDTSNDTKRLEVTTINSNLALQRSLHQEKKLRSSTRSPHDSPVVGPSISK